MALKGDFAKLARLNAQVKQLASGDTRQRLAAVVGATAITEVQLGFRESRDPYGNGWAPLKIRSGGKPLLDTGRLRSSFSYNLNGSGFVVGSNFIGTAVHQHGATITPKRGKFLRFSGKNKQRGRDSRGKFTTVSDVIFARSVTIPRRQMMPEGTLGTRWEKAFNDAATRFISRILTK